MPRLANLALQADLCYNGGRNIVTPAVVVTPRSRIHSLEECIMDTIPPASGIYKITCTANNRIYIGSALNLRERRRAHFGALRRNEHINKHLQNAWNKYGEQAFIFEVLEYILPMSLTAREQYWFNKLKPFGRKGFNIAREAGSTLGYKDSPERIEQKRQSMLGNTHGLGKNLGNKNALGHSHKQSLETREKIRQAKRGHNNSP